MEDTTKWIIEQSWEWWRMAYPWLTTHGISIIVIIGLAIIIKSSGARIVSSLVTRTVGKDLFPTANDREKRIKTLNGLVHASFNLVIWLLAGLLIISELRPQYAGALFASAGVLGIAVGFGAQSLIKDFTSGVFIILENQYRVGDVVSLNNIVGTVESISIRVTSIRDLNGHVHHVPNGIITTTTNRTMSYGMLNEDITVSNKTPLSTLEAIMNDIDAVLHKHKSTKDVLLGPIEILEVTGYSSFGLTIKVTAKTLPGSQWLVKDLFYRELKTQFEKKHVAFPDTTYIQAAK